MPTQKPARLPYPERILFFRIFSNTITRRQRIELSNSCFRHFGFLSHVCGENRRFSEGVTSAEKYSGGIMGNVYNHDHSRGLSDLLHLTCGGKRKKSSYFNQADTAWELMIVAGVTFVLGLLTLVIAA